MLYVCVSLPQRKHEKTLFDKVTNANSACPHYWRVCSSQNCHRSHPGRTSIKHMTAQFEKVVCETIQPACRHCHSDCWRWRQKPTGLSPRLPHMPLSPEAQRSVSQCHKQLEKSTYILSSQHDTRISFGLAWPQLKQVFDPAITHDSHTASWFHKHRLSNLQMLSALAWLFSWIQETVVSCKKQGSVEVHPYWFFFAVNSVVSKVPLLQFVCQIS